MIWLLRPQFRGESTEAGHERDLALTDFGRQVRDALTHLYDVVHLQTHPLARMVKQERGASPSVVGITLRQNLLDAIEALRPSAGAAASSKACRRYRILEMRYIEGMDAIEIEEQMAISKSEYYRQHGEALAAVISLLRERWRLADRVAEPAAVVDLSRDELAQREAEELCARMQVEPLDLSEAINEVLELLSPLSRHKGVALSVELAVGLGLVQADRVVLRQALLNTLRQAMDYATPGALQIRANPAPERAEIVVTAVCHDSGTRIQPKLDLAVSQRLVEGLRGKLRAHCAEGVHTIHVVLMARRCPRVLVVDNSADFVALVSRYLSNEDWEVVAACDAEHAYELAQSVHPQAILLDVMMPGRDGWDLLLKLKTTSHTKEIPVIVCSILNEPHLATSLGASGYLPKPVKQIDLLRALAPWQSGRHERILEL